MTIYSISPAVKADRLQAAIATNAAAYAALTKIIHLTLANAHAQACGQDVHLAIQQDSNNAHGIHRLTVDDVQSGTLFQ